MDDVVLPIAARKAGVVADRRGTPGPGRSPSCLAPGGSARLALASPGALDVDTDGSITVLDGNGSPVAAVGPPAPPSGTEDDAPRIEVTDVRRHPRPRGGRGPDAGRRRESASAAPSRPDRAAAVTFVVGTQAIESATWGENEGGRSLAVDPTDWARHAGQAGLDLIRTQLVAAEPDAGSTTMGDQLVCHAVGAPDKSTWNLEPWRPDVGLILTATAHCNPV